MDIDSNAAKKMTLIDKALGKLRIMGLLDKFIAKWDIPLHNPKQIVGWKEDLMASRKFDEYQEELMKLALKSDWPREDLDVFEDNLILDIYVFTPRRIKVGIVINEITKEKELYIRIFGNTTKDDLRAPDLWRIIKALKSSLPGYVKKNYPDKGNKLRQQELEMSEELKPAQIADKLAKKIDLQVDPHPEVEKMYEKTTGIQISKNIYKQKKILGTERK